MNKLRKITFRDHPILGNLNLDFCDENGKAVDTVIFAGENGSGKSTILNAIYNSIDNILYNFIYIEWETDGVIHYLNIKEMNNQLFGEDDLHKRISGGISFSSFCKTKGIFSDVDINFHTREITTVTSENIDMEKNSRRSDLNLTRQINQLLIDVQALDDADVSKIFRSARDAGEDTNRLVISERMSRFKNAFSKMFDNMVYDRIENQNGHKSILFKKNGKEFPIESLSSGEKQIVYRGCFLLKDANALNGAFVFIDEPEISLHPNWQKKIMDYYKGIFTDENGNQTSQIFAVTHSPFIIHNENRCNDKVIVIERDSQGKIVVKDKPEYYKCDSLELIQDAFSIKNFSDSHSTVFLEGKTDELYFNKALEVFGYEDLPFSFKMVGQYDESKKDKNSGKDALNHAKNFLMARNLSTKNVLLYDCDANKSFEDRNNVITLSLPKFDNKKGISIGIENALILDDIEIEEFRTQRIEIDGYGIEKRIPDFRKMECCNFICGLSNEKLTIVFANLKTQIDQLIKLFDEGKK